ncbi:LuxR C-terminal-related transcriptional regulator [Cellulomonas pakistanensis]|uniref:HTH luxR-type domain-containing protein n=1 Tax=Cellulomonas pakistanensis TaxID=992287 RepID=A0A919PBX1_9CELL|nr:LuxR C-terminal-related transcriptional regulator [Cellulomonas pakistanensis]GIG36858.1 hypothetical protein Cpa01nite_22390 [Cellulomonas pakistanensis]
MHTTDLSPTDAASEVVDLLSPRELVVLAELTSDDSLEDIARRQFVSRNTVKSQVRSIYRKIGASTRDEAVAWARSAGLC